MKSRWNTRIVSLVAVLLCINLCFINVFASYSETMRRVDYIGDSRVFDVLRSKPLFPGDIYTDSIVATNSSTTQKCNFYIKAEPPLPIDGYFEKDEEYDKALELLKQLELEIRLVETSAGPANQVLYSGPADGGAVPTGKEIETNYILLASSVPPSAQAKVNLTLTMPKTLGTAEPPSSGSSGSSSSGSSSINIMDSFAVLNFYIYSTVIDDGGSSSDSSDSSSSDSSSTSSSRGGGGTDQRDTDRVIAGGTVTISEQGPPLGTVEIVDPEVPLAEFTDKNPGTSDSRHGIAWVLALMAAAAVTATLWGPTPKRNMK